MADMTQKDIIIEYFKKNPNRDIKHPEIVDWATTTFLKRTGKIFRDPDRQIRQLSQSGFLIKVKKGVYRYDPDFVVERELEDFTSAQKKKILELGGYKCSQCGRRQEEGWELHVDHLVPKDRGGEATIDNGQILCSICNFRKKNYNQTESGKKMFIRIWEKSIQIGDEHTTKFCEAVLLDFENYNINGHIIWNRKK